MEILIPIGEKEEKCGTVMKDVRQAEKKTDSEMLAQIDGKLDLLLAASETKEG